MVDGRVQDDRERLRAARVGDVLLEPRERALAEVVDVADRPDLAVEVLPVALGLERQERADLGAVGGAQERLGLGDELGVIVDGLGLDQVLDVRALRALFHGLGDDRQRHRVDQLVRRIAPRHDVGDRGGRSPARRGDRLAVVHELQAVLVDDLAQVLHQQLAGRTEERLVVVLREQHDLPQLLGRRRVGDERRLARPVDLAFGEAVEVGQRHRAGGRRIARLDGDGARIGRGRRGRAWRRGRDRVARERTPSQRGDHGRVPGRTLEREQPGGRWCGGGVAGLVSSETGAACCSSCSRSARAIAVPTIPAGA